MKNTKFFIILACMACLFYISCEKTGIQTTVLETSGEQKISNRTVEDCEDCPLDYCCCSIELWNDTDEADLTVCGFSNGPSMCGTFDPPGNCSNFNGIGENILLEESPGNPRVIVCKEKNGVFRIFNNSADTVILRMTCQSDFTVPVFVNITVPDGEEVFYSTNNSCLLSQCQ